MNHKELFEHLINGGSIVDRDGDIAKIIDGRLQFINGSTFIGDTATISDPNDWSIYKPKVKKTFWFVSWRTNRSLRFITSLYDNRMDIENLYKDKEDRQIHSIEIEVKHE